MGTIEAPHSAQSILLTPDLIDRPPNHLSFGDTELNGLGDDPLVLGRRENDATLDSRCHVYLLLG